MTIPIKRRTPHLGLHPDYSKAFYPDPPSHDFLVWLVIAQLMRRHHKAPAPLRVRFGFIQGQLGRVDFGPLGIKTGIGWQCGVDRAYSDQMLAHVLRPAMEMMGAVEVAAIEAPFPFPMIADHCEYDYHIGHLVDAAREGYVVPRFSAPEWAQREVERFLQRVGKQPVVITLRETGAQPPRNSQMAAWLEFAASIAADHPVLFLRDTAKADEPLPPFPGFPTWPLASRNAYVRMALYSQALVNMMVSNGPIGWCQFSDAPFLAFKQLVPSIPTWDHGNEKGWREQAHMGVGDQYPWCSPLQRLTWKDDTFENLKAEFDAFLPKARPA